MDTEYHDNIRYVIERWLYDIIKNKTINIVTGFEVCDNKLYLYTNKPGLLIGMYGKAIDRLHNDLKEIGEDKEICFVELGMYFHTKEIKIERNNKKKRFNIKSFLGKYFKGE